MNYRHVYHAGNFADVLKHWLVVRILRHLLAKPKPFVVIDTHAGIGRYDLDCEAARKTEEADLGIRRLIGDAEAPAPLRDYLALVEGMNPAGGVRFYPGSPTIAAMLLRRDDRIVANEKHPEDQALLTNGLFGQARIRVTGDDGYAALKALVPPPERRGLVLVDPPFEEPGEFARMSTALKAAHRRWATGIYGFWYPIKAEAEPAAFHRTIHRMAVPRCLLVELMVYDEALPDRLNGCGLVLVNPPWTLEAELKETLPYLVKRLGRGGEGRFRVEWLTGEAS